MVMILVENFVGKGFLDAEKMADILDRIALAIEDWNTGFQIIRDTFQRHERSGEPAWESIQHDY